MIRLPLSRYVVGLAALLPFIFKSEIALGETSVAGRVSQVTLYRGQALVTRTIPVEGTAGSLEIVVGKLRVNPASRVVILADQPLVLTPVEFDLLASLARGKGRIKTREQLLDEIRDRNYEVFDRSIDVHISALRKKLGDDPKTPSLIRTVRAAGYMLINPDAEEP